MEANNMTKILGYVVFLNIIITILFIEFTCSTLAGTETDPSELCAESKNTGIFLASPNLHTHSRAKPLIQKLDCYPSLFLFMSLDKQNKF